MGLGLLSHLHPRWVPKPLGWSLEGGDDANPFSSHCGNPFCFTFFKMSENRKENFQIEPKPLVWTLITFWFTKKFQKMLVLVRPKTQLFFLDLPENWKIHHLPASTSDKPTISHWYPNSVKHFSACLTWSTCLTPSIFSKCLRQGLKQIVTITLKAVCEDCFLVTEISESRLIASSLATKQKDFYLSLLCCLESTLRQLATIWDQETVSLLQQLSMLRYFPPCNTPCRDFFKAKK